MLKGVSQTAFLSACQTAAASTTPIILNLPIALQLLRKGLFGRGSSMLAKKISHPVEPSTLKSRHRRDRHVRQVKYDTGWGTEVLKRRRFHPFLFKNLHRSPHPCPRVPIDWSKLLVLQSLPLLPFPPPLSLPPLPSLLPSPPSVILSVGLAWLAGSDHDNGSKVGANRAARI